MAGRARTRAAVLVAAVVGTAAATVLLPASAAFASASSSTVHQQPTDGAASQSTYTTEADLALTASIVRQGCGPLCADSGAPVSMTLSDPTGCLRTLATTQSSSQTSLSFTFNLAEAQLPAGNNCGATDGPARNGSYTLALSGDGASASTVFTVRARPLAPSNVKASAAGPETAAVSWNANLEPDLTGYDILNGNGTPLVTGISPGSACGGSSCAYQVTFSAGSAAGQHTFEVDADRSDGSGGTLTSPPSQPASVTLAGPPPPSSSPSSSTTGSSPAPSGSSGGSSTTSSGTPGPGTGSAGTGKTGGAKSGTARTGAANSGAGNSAAAGSPARLGPLAGQAAVSLSFSDFAPVAGVAELPPLPALAPPVDAGNGEPTNPGTYSPTLNYPDKVVREEVVHPTGPTAIYDRLSASFSGDQLLRSLAAGLIVMLLALHLRSWVRRLSRP